MAKTLKLPLDSLERGILINALIQFRNMAIQEDVPPDDINRLLLKVAEVQPTPVREEPR